MAQAGGGGGGVVYLLTTSCPTAVGVAQRDQWEVRGTVTWTLHLCIPVVESCGQEHDLGVEDNALI